MGKLGAYIRPWWGYIFFAVLVKLLGAVLELFIPWLMEIMLDSKVPEGNVKAIIVYGVLMLFCAGGCLFCNIYANRMSAKSSGKITEAIRHDLFEKLEKLSVRQMELGCSLRINGSQQIQHSLHTFPVCLGFQFFPHAGRRAGGEAVTPNQRIHVQSGAAGNDGSFAS